MGVIINDRRERFKNVWLEKYRPLSLDDIILDLNVKRKIKEYIEAEDIPHLLFLGPPGTGKTTIAYIIIDNLIHDTMDFLELNGSLKRGIGQIHALDDFIKSMTIMSKKKIIFIDEADKLTNDAQDALRNLIEQNSDHLSFIFTANYQYKITEAIQSRMQTFKFKILPKEHIESFIFNVLKLEGIEYKTEDIEYIIKATYPDIRKAMNEINKVVYKDVNNAKILSLGNAGVDFLQEQKFLECLLSIVDLNSKNQNYVDALRYAYSLIYQDNMDYLVLYEKLNNEFKSVRMKTMTAKYYNEVSKVVSPKFLTIEFLGEFLQACIK